ncbi:hypothetical protein H4R21_004756 [Coemansia helicoidea]|nr:hypothetical protein H4R21_004756 [Coemansia helicoidea]
MADSAARAAAPAASAGPSPRSPEDEFPEIGSGARSPDPGQSVDARPSHSSSSAGLARHQSQQPGGARTPARPLPARTPVEVRSGRQPRVCTRPGCAAHAPHTHDDGSPAPPMELKPPVPRFRRRPDDPADSPSQAASLSARPRRAPAAAAADTFR